MAFKLKPCIFLVARCPRGSKKLSIMAILLRWAESLYFIQGISQISRKFYRLPGGDTPGFCVHSTLFHVLSIRHPDTGKWYRRQIFISNPLQIHHSRDESSNNSFQYPQRHRLPGWNGKMDHAFRVKKIFQTFLPFSLTLFKEICTMSGWKFLSVTSAGLGLSALPSSPLLPSSRVSFLEHRRCTVTHLLTISSPNWAGKDIHPWRGCSMHP